jgi:hypothetical protein
MPAMLTRLPLITLLMCGIALAQPVTSHAQGLDSGGLGTSREAWESVHGPGDPINMPSPVWGELTAYPFDGGMYFVAFAGSKDAGGGVVVSLEVAFTTGITDEDELNAAIDPLLPSDKTFADTYFLPPSPGARSALSVFRYESAELDAVPYGTDTLEATFLVMKVGRIEAIRTTSAFESSLNLETTVTRVSIAVAIPEG